MLGEAAAWPNTHRIWGYKAFPAASDCWKISTLLRKHKEGNSVCLFVWCSDLIVSVVTLSIRTPRKQKVPHRGHQTTKIYRLFPAFWKHRRAARLPTHLDERKTVTSLQMAGVGTMHAEHPPARSQSWASGASSVLSEPHSCCHSRSPARERTDPASTPPPPP